jgi:hypothetical protein
VALIFSFVLDLQQIDVRSMHGAVVFTPLSPREGRRLAKLATLTCISR